MKLYEFQGKILFEKMGIPTPQGQTIHEIGSTRDTGDRIGYPVMVKSQVLTGGRGKAGGICTAHDEKELAKAILDLSSRPINGEIPKAFLIEKKLEVDREFYASITYDVQASAPLLMVSAHGGVDIEELAQTSPQKLIKYPIHPLKRPRLFHMVELTSRIGLTDQLMVRAARIFLNLVAFYFKFDALTAEINPLITDKSGNLFAADAKVEIDDSALFRVDVVRDFQQKQKNQLSALEREARAEDLAYVRLKEGNIGVIAGGAGLGMATMDMVAAYGGKPANFLDLGGGASREKTASALRIVLKTPGVSGILMNLFGGINNCEEMAKGIDSALTENRPSLPIVVKMRGHFQEEGWRILENRNIPIVKFGTTEEAVKLLLDKMKETHHGHTH